LPAGSLGEQLEVYFRLLATWNSKINLTGLDLSEPAPETIDRLLIEPLIAARHSPPGVTAMIDIGSGGGSPAIPFALALPRPRVRLVESKVRKSVFLREALRATGLADGEVITARFEELLARPALHEAHELLTIRAVRIEPRVLMGVQAFVKPGGQLFLFRGESGADVSSVLTPPLAWHATYPLIESLRSRLVILSKRSAGRVDVPRGTI
jgi:16S rRNA (guanine527-N7)-methyltransferase